MAQPVTLSYCAEQVRRYDHDRFMTAIFAPAAARENLFALYAFNIEVAKVREAVTEPLIGRMRLQWWRDALDRLFAGETVAHAVAAPLGDAIRAASLDRMAFERLIDAREADLEDTPPKDMRALEAYAEGTGTPLLALAFQLAGASAADPEVARLAGTAWALTGLLRAVPFHARHRRIYLPEDVLAAHTVRIQRLLDLKPGPGFADAVRTVGERARELLRDLPGRIGGVPRAARSPALVASLSRYYLRDLERRGWDPFVLEQRPARPLRVARLAWRAALRGY
jgi:phytoene synthase